MILPHSAQSLRVFREAAATIAGPALQELATRYDCRAPWPFDTILHVPRGLLTERGDFVNKVILGSPEMHFGQIFDSSTGAFPIVD